MADVDLNEVHLWLFEEAPQEYQDLSENGGDEDWVMFVPERLESHPLVISMSEKIDVSYSPEEHEVEGGWVFIGSHA